MIEQLTSAQAVEFYESGAWKRMSSRELAEFQLHQDCLCVPFDEFHRAITEALGRDVYTHEFASSSIDRLKAEFAGIEKVPTLVEIVNKLPADKPVILVEVGS